MNKKFTLENLTTFTRNEKEILASVGLTKSKKEEISSPGQHVIDNLLNYSKALSIRKSETFGKMEMVLN